jgi:hypothetical protein
MYMGDFHRGEMNGQGTHTRANGEQYTGEHVLNMREGAGTLMTEDNETIEGNF